MNVALWVLQGLLAVVFLGAGTMKLLRPRKDLAPQMPYVEDVADGTVKFIGAMEVLGALGLILPGVTGIATILTPLAATGLVVLMGLAAATHVRRKEPQGVMTAAVLLVLAALVAIGRFGPYSL